MAPPEQISLRPSHNVPNNTFPALVYRDAIPGPHSEEDAIKFLEQNAWEWRGTHGALYDPHFHPNCHECYGIFRGTGSMVLGSISESPADGGVVVDLRPGDVLVVPSGVAHVTHRGSASPDFRYVAVYPKESPRWRNEFGKTPLTDAKMQRDLASVGIPSQDPVEGERGAMMRIWSQAQKTAKL